MFPFINPANEEESAPAVTAKAVLNPRKIYDKTISTETNKAR